MPKKDQNNKGGSVDVKTKIQIHYAETFGKIMEMDNILPQDIMSSLSLEENRKSVF